MRGLAFRFGYCGAGLEAEAVVSGLQDQASVGKMIEQCRCHLGVTEHRGPFAEAEAGCAETWRRLAKVTGVRPRGLYEVLIEAVTEDPSVHTADQGVVADPIRTSSLPRRITKPKVGGLLCRRIPGDNSRAVLAWRAAAGAETYHIEMAEGADVDDPTVSWTRVADTTAANHVITLLYAAKTLIRVRGVGLIDGPWLAAALGTLIPEMWNSNATAMWTSDPNPMWS